MNKTKNWHERNTFWKNVEPVLFREQRLVNAASEIDKIISLIGINPGSHILDLCCGVGRHSLELARRGFTVTGVDNTTRYLKQAKARAKKEALNIEFIMADMRKFLRKNRFDVVMNLFTSFGFFENQKDDKRVISNVYKSLKFGGAFVMDLIGKEVVAKDFQKTGWVDFDGLFLLEKRKIYDNWSRIHNTWILIKEGRQKVEELDLRLYSASELKTLLIESGFKRVDVYGNLVGDPYDEKAQRLVLVGHK
jgi:ubiquinone/menaquinone biosynthesis C-methylase UbiE